MNVQILETIEEFQKKIPSFEEFNNRINSDFNFSNDEYRKIFFDDNDPLAEGCLNFYNNAISEIDDLKISSDIEPRRFNANLFMLIVYINGTSQLDYYIRKHLTFWFYMNNVYGLFFTKKDRTISLKQQQLLIYEAYDKDRKKWERLEKLYAKGVNSKSHSQYIRERIPEQVRIEVWRRDDGKCVRCGSREKLEYDHIVPVSKGGSNTSRNIELLCEKCNRQKSANI